MNNLMLQQQAGNRYIAILTTKQDEDSTIASNRQATFETEPEAEAWLKEKGAQAERWGDIVVGDKILLKTIANN